MVNSSSSVAVVSIVDDDDSVRAAACSLVRSLGLIARGFASAEDFLQSPELDRTSCVISDVQMPKMNGIELQSALIAQGRRIPIIFFTAFPNEALEARAMQAGAIAFLSKPYEGKDIVECLERAIGPGFAGQ